MSFITLYQVGVSTPTPLFKNLSFTIEEGCRLGVVAKNGGGKTTLLHCIAGRNEPTEGIIRHSRGLCLGSVEQDASPALLQMSLFDCLRLALWGMPINKCHNCQTMNLLLTLSRTASVWAINAAGHFWLEQDFLLTGKSVRLVPFRLGKRRDWGCLSCG